MSPQSVSGPLPPGLSSMAPPLPLSAMPTSPPAAPPADGEASLPPMASPPSPPWACENSRRVAHDEAATPSAAKATQKPHGRTLTVNFPSLPKQIVRLRVSMALASGAYQPAGDAARRRLVCLHLLERD